MELSETENPLEGGDDNFFNSLGPRVPMKFMEEKNKIKQPKKK